MPEAETSRGSSPTDLEHLPQMRKDLKEVRGLRSRLKEQKAILDDDRYKRILKSYTAEIEQLEPIVEELKEKAETRKEKMEKQLGQEVTKAQDLKEKIKDPSVEDEEKERLIEESKRAEDKAKAAREEIQKLKFYLTGERTLFNQRAGPGESSGHQTRQNQDKITLMDSAFAVLEQKLTNPGIVGCLAFLLIVGGISSAQVGSLPSQEPYTWTGVVATLFWFVVAQSLGYFAGRKESEGSPIGSFPNA